MGSRNRRWPRPPTWVVASADETQRQGARGNDVMDLISQLMSWFMPLIASRRGSPRPPHAARHGQRCRLHEARHGVLPQGGHRCWGQGIPRHGKITDDEINAASVTCCRIYLRSESEPGKIQVSLFYLTRCSLFVLSQGFILKYLTRYAYLWWKEKVIDSYLKRKDGLCPLTPELTYYCSLFFCRQPEICHDLVPDQEKLSSTESQLIYWDSKVSEADMDAMWKHPDVYKEWIKSGERRGNVRFSHDAKNMPYLSRVEVKVGLMLRGMDFSNKTAIFLASGKIYKAEKNMASLLEMFPLLQTKETLASEEELAPFKMAAVDYSICAQSEVFVTTQGGNPAFFMGHRRYLYGGHSKTIKPDKRRLAVLFNNPRIGWTALKRHLLNMRAYSDVKGIEMKRPNESIYTFPCPDCMCRLNRTEHSKSKQSR
ncbi:O-fucosyltransferase family protein [Zea mays]|uniref:O-fucosyltransferase family protein n=1 Tax=Zea mays TaxID=4577 RepID=A0A1D6I706_MAIZE|nr:O-fucosyltransferase family protein [Zea mays]